MKICHFTSAHSWNDIRIFVKQCSSLASFGFTVTLISPGAETKRVNNINIWTHEFYGAGNESPSPIFLFACHCRPSPDDRSHRGGQAGARGSHAVRRWHGHDVVNLPQKSNSPGFSPGNWLF